MNTFTLVDGNDACWYRDSSGISMLMLYDGIVKMRLTDSAVNNEFGFSDGKIVWSESYLGVFQIMIYDINTKTKNNTRCQQAYKPITDATWQFGSDITSGTIVVL
jgi:hypothetical protein